MYRQNFNCTVMASFFLRLAGKCIIRQVKREKKGNWSWTSREEKGNVSLWTQSPCFCLCCCALWTPVEHCGEGWAASLDFTDLSRFTDALYRFFFKTEGVHAVVWILAHQWGFSLLVKSETVGLKVLLGTKGKIWVFFGAECSLPCWSVKGI